MESEAKEGRRQRDIPDQGDCLCQGLEEKNNVMFGDGEDLQTVQCSQGSSRQGIGEAGEWAQKQGLPGWEMTASSYRTVVT